MITGHLQSVGASAGRRILHLRFLWKMSDRSHFYPRMPTENEIIQPFCQCRQNGKNRIAYEVKSYPAKNEALVLGVPRSWSAYWQGPVQIIRLGLNLIWKQEQPQDHNQERRQPLRECRAAERLFCPPDVR